MTLRSLRLSILLSLHFLPRTVVSLSDCESIEEKDDCNTSDICAWFDNTNPTYFIDYRRSCHPVPTKCATIHEGLYCDGTESTHGINDPWGCRSDFVYIGGYVNKWQCTPRGPPTRCSDMVYKDLCADFADYDIGGEYGQGCIWYDDHVAHGKELCWDAPDGLCSHVKTREYCETGGHGLNGEDGGCTWQSTNWVGKGSCVIAPPVCSDIQKKPACRIKEACKWGKNKMPACNPRNKKIDCSVNTKETKCVKRNWCAYVDGACVHKCSTFTSENDCKNLLNKKNNRVCKFEKTDNPCKKCQQETCTSS